MQTARYFCLILTRSGAPRLTYMTVANIKSHRNPPSGSRADICGRRDGRHDEAKRRQKRAPYSRLTMR
jgi:hypothetical protein